jgi:outer membrane protein OmpA-like peptidoglycan-associated protein
MKQPIFLTLLLSIALALPGFAQQTNSTSDQTAPASQSASTSEREPIPPPATNGFWDGDDPNLVNLVTHPFANKKYVQRRVGPIRDRLNELDQITSENGNTVKNVDSRATQGIQLASEKVNLADQHATEANNKAQEAQTSATQASTRVTSVEQMVSNIDQYKGEAQTEIRFQPGQTVLSKSAKDALDQMVEPLKGQRSYIVEVRGFAPGHGQAAIANSRKMADSVQRYLVLNHQIPVYRVYVMSMGNAPAGADGAVAAHNRGGRVEVNVLKNEMGAGVQH